MYQHDLRAGRGEASVEGRSAVMLTQPVRCVGIRLCKCGRRADNVRSKRQNYVT